MKYYVAINVHDLKSIDSVSQTYPFLFLKQYISSAGTTTSIIKKYR